MDPCNCQPLDIPHAEHVARAVYYSFHLRNNRTLKWQAFEADKGKDDISVMRAGCLSSSECKQLAKQSNAVRREYEGFALLVAGAVRNIGFSVEDSRHIYCGHADILLHLLDDSAPIETSPEEPPDPLYRARQKEVGERLIEISTLRLDSDLALLGWNPNDPWLPR